MTTFNERLIKLVQNYPHLYDASATFYKDTIKKENSWKEIGLQLGQSALVCSKRWKTLRDRYTKEKRKMQRKRANGVAADKRMWKLMPLMDFLTSHIFHRTSLDDLPTAQLSCLHDQEQESANVTALAENNLCFRENLLPELEDFQSSSVNLSDTDSSNYKMNLQDTIRASSALENQEKLFAAMARIGESIEQSRVEEEDDASHFGKLIAAKLRRMPPHVADEVMSNILLDLRKVELPSPEDGKRK